MSQRAETRISDIVVLILFVLIVGWFASRSFSPAESSIPGVSWAPAPARPAATELIQESKTVVEGDPVTPPDATPGQSEEWQ